ncbi:MAG: hypothetical protein I3273_01370 [Candidatus Moeniiplasma glomeromycotorum]|nr:hypothetical protein [Candidatus Moeniiplasma glomeromycotorum]MCE8167228.1 hypothetical protein [Candidatus Moeniiplasma glomeromycotorum]MCE8168759.1 hypothetical protein [Candidatus Moeniiplasma glomeromycotorum]
MPQSNLITLHEIYTRTELWKDHIYFLSSSPYLFPKNNGQGDFFPLPKRFAEITNEFRFNYYPISLDEIF